MIQLSAFSSQLSARYPVESCIVKAKGHKLKADG